MQISFYDLSLCFFLYSFAGWVLEVCYYSWKRKRFVNPGFLNGPFCPAYGVGLVWMLVAFQELQSRPVFQFLAYAVTASFLQYVTGQLMIKLFHRKLWDYSGQPHNIDGLVSLRSAAFWGAASMVVIRLIHPFSLMLIRMLPAFLGNIAWIVLSALLVIDVLVTSGAILYENRYQKQLHEIAEELKTFADRLGYWLYSRIEKRIERATPGAAERAKEQAQSCAVEKNGFAAGCCFYKLVWLFFIGAFLGDLTETVFCRLTAGVWMSRSSVVYGPFSIVWGMGVVLLTATLYRFYEKEDRYIFVAGTVLGGAYEYLCSVFTELVFGTVFWDYSKIPFNLGGRINLLYCFFWGIAAIIWLKVFYPRLSAYIEKIPVRIGKILSWLFIAFMAVNIVLSSLALARYTERNTAETCSDTLVSEWLDRHFPDERMERIYPNAIIRK